MLPALHTQNQIETLCTPTIGIGNNDCDLLLHTYYTIFVCTSVAQSDAQSDLAIISLHLPCFLTTNHLDLLITPSQTYSSKFTEAQQLAHSEPDPPFTFERGVWE